jgi:hypothetical protein
MRRERMLGSQDRAIFMNVILKLLGLGVAVFILMISAYVGWLFATGRAQKMLAARDELRNAMAHPGAAGVRKVPGCAVPAVFETKDFWTTSSELKQRFPTLSDLPRTLVMCGVGKHVMPPAPHDVAEAFTRAVPTPESIVVVVMRSRHGEEVFNAEVFEPVKKH